MLALIRIFAIVTAVVATLAYLAMLVLVSYGYCYMDSAGCRAGQVARTIVTGIYLAVVATVIALTRWGLKVGAQRIADRRDGIM